MFDPQQLPLRLPIGAPFPVAVVDATPSLSRYVIRIRVDPDTWSQIEDLELFHLIPGVRNPGSVSGDIDVELELRLADELVAGVIEMVAGLSPADGVAALADLDGAEDRGGAVLVTESWFATHVTEKVPLPDDLADSGSLRQGFSTSWADADQLVDEPPERPEPIVETRPDPAAEPWPPLLDIVRGYLVAHDVVVDRHPRANMVSGPIVGEHGEWSLWVHTREDSRQVVAYSVLSADIADERYAAVAEYAVRLNAKMFSGSFEFDLDSGAWSCRTSLTLNGAELTDDLVAGLVHPNLVAFDAALPGVSAVIDGMAPADAAMQHPPVT